jgi:uncharacterized protein YeaO (DUF488 family)
MLYTRCILSPRDALDGMRISVMSRHTLNDGVTPDERIGYHSYDLWMKSLAPPDTLVGAYYRNLIQWPDFEMAYIEHIRNPDISMIIEFMSSVAENRNITLLCIEELLVIDQKQHLQCHRRLLAEEFCRIRPELKMAHR